jgi:hypothetical protein
MCISDYLKALPLSFKNGKVTFQLTPVELSERALLVLIAGTG